jgi:hypothetical protein
LGIKYKEKEETNKPENKDQLKFENL